MPARILIVTQYFWPENFRINDLVAGLTERGHSVTVLTGQPNYPGGKPFAGYGFLRKWREARDGVEILRCPLITRGSGEGLRLALNYLSFALSASVLAPFRCRGKFDAIFVYEPSPITVALPALVLNALGRGPVLLWVLDLWPDSVQAAGGVRSARVLAAIAGLVRFIYRRCDRVLVQSQSFMDRVKAMGAAPARVRYFPSWAEDVFSRQPAHAPQLPALPAGFRVMFAGNIGAAQDFPSILAAAELLKAQADIQWVVLGDGRMADWVRAQVAARGLDAQVRLLGSFPVDTMPGFYAQADCLLVSLKREPIFALTIPAKIQSYLACGRPIVGMLDGEGARVIEQSGAGFAGPAEQPDRLAQNVLRLYRLSPADRVALGQAGYAYYRQEFLRERLLSRLEQWMREAAAERLEG